MNRRSKRLDNALAKGTRLENYILGDVLGAGAFGITYCADDVDLRTQVAIKEYLPCDFALRGEGTSMVLPRSSKSESDYQYGLDRFLAEAQTLAQFRHSNIVSVKRFFKANNSAYLVMDYEEGHSLGQYLADHPTPDEKTLKKIIVPILLGLKVIHQHGYLHRDIKPSNIYLRDNGLPLLIDFGAARYALGDHTGLITSIVTPGYCPFEQYSTHGKQGPYTDLYAIGATLYKCTTGQTPMDVSLRVDARIRNKNDPLVMASELVRGQYSQEFLEVIDQLMNPDAQSRPQTVDAVLDKLRSGLKESDYTSTIDATTKKQNTEHPTQITPGLPDVPTTVVTEDSIESANQILSLEVPPASDIESEAVDSRQKRTLVLIVVAAFVIGITIVGSGWIWMKYQTDLCNDNTSALEASLGCARNLIDDKDYVQAKSVLEKQRVQNPDEPRIKNLLAELEQKMKNESSRNHPSAGIPGHSVVKGTGNPLSSKLLPEMLRVSGGCFDMGTPLGEAGRDSDERSHQVCVNDFSIGKYEVTFDEYDRFANDTGLVKPGDEGWGRGRRPVIHVSAQDAKAYTQWLSAQTGQQYRLPTEAEWEYACRGGELQQTFCGGSSADKVAWYIGNSGYKTQAVGKKKPNQFGLYDMSGNVWEWTCSLYSVDYDGSESNCGKGNGQQVLRGGSWGNEPGGIRAANRPRRSSPIYLLNFIGFRVVHE